MYSRGIMTRAAIAIAILLFAISPLLHQHYRAPVPDCGSLSTLTSSSAACSICTFQSNVAIQTPTASEEAPSVASYVASVPQAIFDSELALTLSSRAPPAIS
jgi:hypothetical protein